MRPNIAATLAVLLLVQPAGAALGQDLLKPLQRLVEDLVPERKPAPERPRPAPVAAEAEETDTDIPPVPLPRPEGLGDEEEDGAAPVDEPASPADEAETPSRSSEDGPAVDAPETDAETAVDAPAAEPAEPAEPETAPGAEAAPAAPEGPYADGRTYQVACPAVLDGTVVAEMLPTIAEGICGAHSPLSMTAVNVNGHQIAFASPVTTNCSMAGAIADWVGEVDTYAKAALESPVEQISSGPGLVCRNRVGGDEDKISEHAFADAVDIMGFTLANGETISVESGWSEAEAPEGRFLRQAHGAACGRFTTVLGPEANADHHNHFHLDLGCHGKTCTAQICE